MVSCLSVCFELSSRREKKSLTTRSARKMGIVSKKRGINDKGGCLVEEVLFRLYFINKALRGDKEMGK